MEFDKRMSDETIQFLNSALISNQKLLAEKDLNTKRKLLIANLLEANKSLQFENVKEIQYSIKNKDDNYTISFTCYKPDNCPQNAPITLYIHGGGYTYFDVKSYSSLVKLLALKTNSVWLSVDYRLCPEFKHPIGFTDCKYVFEYVSNNKSEFSTDKVKLGISGDSSGATYCALLSNEFYSTIDYQILIYGGFNLYDKYSSQFEFTQDCYLLTDKIVDFYKSNLLGEEQLNENSLKNEKYSPYYKQSFEFLPKTLLLAAELDNVRDQSVEYFKKLQQFKVDSELRIIKGVLHGFFSYPVQMKNAHQEAINYIVNFFNSI